MNAGFVLFRGRVFAGAIPIGGRDITDCLALLRREQELFPHFGEAGSAIFLIQEIEYGGHNHPRRFIDITHPAHRIVSGGFRLPRKMVSSASSLSDNGFFSEEDCFFAALEALLAGITRDQSCGPGQNPFGSRPSDSVPWFGPS